MTELGHVAAETANKTADQSPVAEQRAGSSDSQVRYATADADPGFYDGDIKAAIATDTTPTRQQAAREDASDHQTPSATANVSRDAPASGHAPDIKAILHENDSLPGPRTRQEAARDADGDQHERSGPHPLADVAARDVHATCEQPFTVVHIGPEVRTLGDFSPTGIGLKPSGDQIVEVEDQKASRAERARKEFLSKEDLGDAFDATDEWAKTGQDLFRRPPTAQHTEVPAQGPAFALPVPQEIDPGNVATAGLALGILGAEFIRWGRHQAEHMRGRHRAGDR